MKHLSTQVRQGFFESDLVRKHVRDRNELETKLAKKNQTCAKIFGQFNFCVVIPESFLLYFWILKPYLWFSLVCLGCFPRRHAPSRGFHEVCGGLGE